MHNIVSYIYTAKDTIRWVITDSAAAMRVVVVVDIAVIGEKMNKPGNSAWQIQRYEQDFVEKE